MKKATLSLPRGQPTHRYFWHKSRLLSTCLTKTQKATLPEQPGVRPTTGDTLLALFERSECLVDQLSPIVADRKTKPRPRFLGGKQRILLVQRVKQTRNDPFKPLFWRKLDRRMVDDTVHSVLLCERALFLTAGARGPISALGGVLNSSQEQGPPPARRTRGRAIPEDQIAPTTGTASISFCRLALSVRPTRVRAASSSAGVGT